MENSITIMPLRELAKEIFTGVPIYNVSAVNGDSESIPLINIKDIIEGQVIKSGLSYIRRTNLKNIEKSTVFPSDILITCRGTQLKVAVVPNTLPQALITSNLIAIRLGEQMIPGFLSAYLKSTYGQQALLSRATSSTTQLVLTISQIGGMEIPVPPLSLQAKIANFANAAAEQYRLSIESANLMRIISNQIIINMLSNKED